MTVKIASVIHVSSPNIRRAVLLEVHPDGASARVDNALSKLLALTILLPEDEMLTPDSVNAPAYSFNDAIVATGAQPIRAANLKASRVALPTP